MDIRKNQRLLTCFIFLFGLIAIGFSSNALAISSSSVHCNHRARNKIKAAGNYAFNHKGKPLLNNDRKHLNSIAKSGIFNKIKSCTDLTNPTSFFHIPSLTNLMKDLGRRAKNAACNKARNMVGNAMGSYTKSLSINTGIPGVNTVGGSLSAGKYGLSGGLHGAGTSAYGSANSGF